MSEGKNMDVNIRRSTYTLPELSFVGGESQDIGFYLYTSGGLGFDASGCSVSFDIVSYSNKLSDTVVHLASTNENEIQITSGDLSPLDPNGNPIPNYIMVSISNVKTVGLYGKYVYQITIKDISSGESEIPSQGLMYITNNINKSFIS